MTDAELDAALERFFARHPERIEAAVSRYVERNAARFRGAPGRDGRDGLPGASATAAPPIVRVIADRGPMRTRVTEHDALGRIVAFEQHPIAEDED